MSGLQQPLPCEIRSIIPPNFLAIRLGYSRPHSYLAIFAYNWLDSVPITPRDRGMEYNL
jgi:hypothetical protein